MTRGELTSYLLDVPLVRAFLADDPRPATGVVLDGRFHPLPLDLAELLALPVDEIRRLIDAARSGPSAESWQPLAPVSGLTEVWAAGVTYERSRSARVAESDHEADVYERVYDAERPELFFKSTSWRVVGPGEPIAVRADSEVNVPEPELAVVVNAHGEIVGYTICNDVSSRSIEGENPLYLPQAKVYLGGCAVGPAVVPAWDLPDPRAVDIAMTIERAGEVGWHGTTNTALLHREIPDLVEHLFRADSFPQGVVLSTGTCLVPDLPFTLSAGDLVIIELAGIGTLTNPVVVGKQPMGWLVDRLAPVSVAAAR